MTKPATALIVDDEPLARRKLAELLADVEWLRAVGEAADGETAARSIDDLRPDVVFLDIEMPGLSGIRVLERCRHRPVVVFTTAFDRYAVTAFELEALDYLLKPFGRERFQATLRRLREALDRPDADVLERAGRAIASPPPPLDRLFVRDRGRIVPIAVGDIVRLEAEDVYVAVFTGGRRYLVHAPLHDIERRLDPSRFLRIHRCHVVNLDFVAAFRPMEDSRLEVQMKDGTRLAASRARSKELRERV